MLNIRRNILLGSLENKEGTFELWINSNSSSNYLWNTHTFKKGMTWGEFLESDYNDGNFMISSNKLSYNVDSPWEETANIHTENHEQVLLTDKIINGYSYVLPMSRLSPDEPI